MNDQQRAAMQMALGALESKYIVNCGAWRVQQDEAINALREALAQPQGAWIDLTDDEIRDCEDESEPFAIELGRSIITKFKEKNTPPVVPQGEPDCSSSGDSEPVAWMRDNEDCTDCFVWERDEEHTIPLYITPPSSQRADALVEAAIEATKEKAAKVCDDMSNTEANMNKTWRNGCSDAAAAIRARGDHE